MKTVWLLGSGFSKPLDGPLLMDLFRREEHEDIEPFYPEERYPDLARTLVWVQLCFQRGLAEGLWRNAEQFMSYVDDAYQDLESPRVARLKVLVGRCNTVAESLLNSWTIHPSEDGRKYQAFKSAFHEDLDRRVKRALAAECSRFLIQSVPTSERWDPYRNWIKYLRPDEDTVLCFNYDRVIETAAAGVDEEKKFWFAMPDEECPVGKVPVLKLHGSVDWKLVEANGDRNVDMVSPQRVAPGDILRSEVLTIGIAAPGSSKLNFVTKHLGNLWTIAEQALKDAQRLVIVGYSFPDTDSTAQRRLLSAFGTARGKPLWAHIVLGSDATPTSRRMRALIRSTCPKDQVSVSEYTERRTGDVLTIVEHPLGTQDFIGRADAFLLWR